MTVAHLEQVFKRGPHEVNNHDIVIALLPGPHDPRHASSAHQRLVYPRLLLQRAVPCDCRLDFDCNLLARDRVHAEEHSPCNKHHQHPRIKLRRQVRAHHSRHWQSPPRVCTCQQRSCSRRPWKGYKKEPPLFRLQQLQPRSLVS